MHRGNIHPASFRDPSGFIFEREGKLLRQVNHVYKQHYDLFIQSGLYHKLVSGNFIIPHKEVQEEPFNNDGYIILEPQQLDTITYPSEWCFSQLKDAALATLAITQMAIDHGMILKDATPYNIQFVGGHPLHIDTLSFETYDASKPWVAYRQFCNCFLFPLYMAHYSELEVHKIFAAFPEGITAEITADLLPIKSRFNAGALMHVHLQNSVTARPKNESRVNFTKSKLQALLANLQSITSQLVKKTRKSAWSAYYTSSILSDNYLSEKESVFTQLLDLVPPGLALDLGANNGNFSNILAAKSFKVIAVDNDSNLVEELYGAVKSTGASVLPLVLDVTNATPSSGLGGIERQSFHQRIQPTVVTALALIHHLAVGRNIPLNRLASYFSTFSPWLIIEWVPKEDPKVQEMLAGREDIFNSYTLSSFEQEFSLFFKVHGREKIHNTERWIYLMKRTDI